MRLRVGRFALVASAVAMLSGCVGEHGQMPLSGLAPSSSAASGTSAALLYVAHGVKTGSGYSGLLSVLTFPQGKPVATIVLPGEFATATCADSLGNVWAIVGSKPHRRYRYSAYEYARGGTTPIAKIAIPRTSGITTGCAVDPTTGNLAVLTGFYEGSAPAHIDIWAGAHEGKPKRYPINFSPIACGYDANGNLFIDGYVGSTVIFELDELPAGGTSIHGVKTGFYDFPGGIEWDGEYLGVVSGGTLYRVSVSSYVAHVAGTVHLRAVQGGTPIAISDGSIAANRGIYGYTLSLWQYPAGGKATKRLARLEYGARGLTISAGSAERGNESL